MFHWIELRAFCHATEEEERVVAALRTVTPEGEVRRDVVEGHFGNPLVILTAKVEAAGDVKAVWSRVVAAFGKAETLRDLLARLDDDGVYHVRIEKQRAYAGSIEKASGADVIALRAKVAAFPQRRDIAVGVLRDSVESM